MAVKFDKILGKVREKDADSSTYVPYTGATANVNLGSYKMTATGVTSKHNIILTSGRKLIFDGS